LLTCRARISRIACDGYYSATKKPRETLQILVPVLLVHTRWSQGTLGGSLSLAPLGSAAYSPASSPEQFQARRRRWLVKLLVKSISAGKRPGDRRTEIQITYRFGPPSASEDYPEDSFVETFKNGREFCTRATDTLTLTVVTVK
jgi:hypothetical protein